MAHIFLFTLNCAKTSQLRSIAEAVGRSLPEESPDLFVFGFQELVELLPSLTPGVVDEELSQLKALIATTVEEKYGIEVFKSVNSSVGAIGSFVLSVGPIESVLEASTTCGLMYSSLKGGCGLRIKYNHQYYTFVTAHLSANEGQLARRIQDSTKVLRGLQFGDGWSVLRPQSHVFFMGDLNFRSRSGDALLSNDELIPSMSRGECFPGFDECAIAFKPTYKFNIGTDTYNKKRIPSWCDRILFLKYPRIVKSEYQSAPVLTSDHHAVYLDLTVDQLPAEAVSTRGQITSQAGEVIDMSLSTTVQLDAILRLIGDFVVWISLWLTRTTLGRVLLCTLVLGLCYMVL